MSDFEFIKEKFVELGQLIKADGYDFVFEISRYNSVYIYPFIITKKYSKRKNFPNYIRISDHPSHIMNDVYSIEPVNPNVERVWRYAKRHMQKKHQLKIDQNFRQKRKELGNRYAEI